MAQPSQDADLGQARPRPAAESTRTVERISDALWAAARLMGSQS